MSPTHDELLFATLIELADTTVTGLDVMSLADRLVEACVELVGVAAAGIMLADQHSDLRVFASTNEESRMLELLELQNNDGPCLEAFRTGGAIDGVDLSLFIERWPSFAPAAITAGIHSAYAVPMRLRDRTIGALNLFLTGTEPLSPHQLDVARVMADMASIGIINSWSMHHHEALTQQLQGALTSRVVIEQAKGVLSERDGLSMGQAFDYLRRTARSARRPIADVADDFVTGHGAHAQVPVAPRVKALDGDPAA
jgi:GAF domain-containing protein